jgi:hypothetical protein
LVTTCVGLEASSTTTSWTLRPSRPPLALTWSAHSWYPRSTWVAGSEKSPERDNEMPILIGLAVWAPLFDAVPEEQAASRSVATSVAAKLSRASGLPVASMAASYAVDCTGER